MIDNIIVENLEKIKPCARRNFLMEKNLLITGEPGYWQLVQIVRIEFGNTYRLNGFLSNYGVC
jgi:hypothetical protein